MLIDETDREYHEQSGKYLASHLLGVFMDCPRVYKATVDKEHTRPDTEAYALGRAVHCLILEGEAVYNQKYVMDSPVNPKTSKPYGVVSKAYCDWATWARECGLEPINRDQDQLAHRMYKSVAFHNEAKHLLDASPYREKVIRHEYQGVACQIRMDAIGEEGLVDLKTCDVIKMLPSQAWKYGYYNQLAFYNAVVKASPEGFPDDAYIIAVEKRYPYRCGVWHIAKSSLTSASEENEMAIEELKHCKLHDTWPTRYEEIRELKSYDLRAD